jgi:hypothetical protein
VTESWEKRQPKQEEEEEKFDYTFMSKMDLNEKPDKKPAKKKKKKVKHTGSQSK